MTDTTQHTAEFEANLKSAVVIGAAKGDETVNCSAMEAAVREAISTEYHKHVDCRRELYQKAVEVGDEDTVRVAEDNLNQVMDWMGDVFAAGHSRLNKALEAFETGDITVDVVQFESEKYGGDGAVLSDELPVEEGDLIPIVHSASGNTYLLTSENESEGHATCNCHDKRLNDGFPICKHEIVWLLTQVVLSQRGLENLIDPSVLSILTAITESKTPSGFETGEERNDHEAMVEVTPIE